MRRVFSKWFECEKGHITVGDNKKTVCDAEQWQLNYEKGKRKGQWIPKETKTESCKGKIIEDGDIPEKIDMLSVWDYKLMHAFLVGQKFDAEFMIELQKTYKELYDRIQLLEEETYAKK